MAVRGTAMDGLLRCASTNTRKSLGQFLNDVTLIIHHHDVVHGHMGLHMTVAVFLLDKLLELRLNVALAILFWKSVAGD